MCSLSAMISMFEMYLQAKEIAVNNIFRSALGIVEEVMSDAKGHVPSSSVSNPSMELIARQANRIRQRMRPDEPTDMTFEVTHIYIFIQNQVCGLSLLRAFVHKGDTRACRLRYLYPISYV